MKKIFCVVLCTLVLFNNYIVAAENKNSEFELSADTIYMQSEPSTAKVKILKGKNYELFCGSSWLKCIVHKNGTLVVTADKYKFYRSRKTMVFLTSQKTNYTKVLTVIQKKRIKIPLFIASPKGTNIIALSNMDMSKATFYYIKKIQKNKSADENSLELKGSKYESGIGTHAPSIMCFKLNGAKSFSANLGIDDEVWKNGDSSSYGIVDYEIFLDGKSVAKGNINLLQNDPARIRLDVSHAETMKIVFNPGEETYGDHVDLCNAYFVYNGEAPQTVKAE